MLEITPATYKQWNQACEDAVPLFTKLSAELLNRINAFARHTYSSEKDERKALIVLTHYFIVKGNEECPHRIAKGHKKTLQIRLLGSQTNDAPIKNIIQKFYTFSKNVNQRNQENNTPISTAASSSSSAPDSCYDLTFHRTPECFPFCERDLLDGGLWDEQNQDSPFCSDDFSDPDAVILQPRAPQITKQSGSTKCNVPPIMNGFFVEDTGSSSIAQDTTPPTTINPTLIYPA